MSEQGGQVVETACSSRRRERRRETVPLLARGCEARLSSRERSGGAARNLPAVILGLAHDGGDLRILEIEGRVQEVDCALNRREELEQHEKRHREGLRERR